MNRNKIKIPLYIIITLSLVVFIIYKSRAKAYDTTYAAYGSEYEETASTVCRVYGPYNVYSPEQAQIPYKYFDSIEDACNTTNVGQWGNYTIEVTQQSVEINDTLNLPQGVVLTTSSDLLGNGNRATITRGSGCTGAMVTASSYQSSINNINFDGGWGSNHSGSTASGPIINLGTEVTLTNVSLENNYNTSSDGGGAIVSSASLTLNNVTIENCGSTYAGAIKSTDVVISNDATIENCYSTNTTGNTTSAIYVNANDYGLKINNITVTHCAAVNASTGGETIYSSNNIDIGNSVTSGASIDISDNYSAGTLSGILQATGQSCNVRIYDDATISGNKSGCTFDNSWDVLTTGDNSNLNIVNPETTYINFTPTNSSEVGISVVGEDMSGDDVEFAITSIVSNSVITVAGYTSDYDGSSVTGANGHAYVNYTGSSVEPPGPDPSGNKTIYVKILQNEYSGVSHSYKVQYNWNDIDTQTLTGEADDSNCITIPITVAENSQGTLVIILDNYYNGNITYSDFEVVSVDNGISTPTVQSSGDIPYNVQASVDTTVQNGAIVKVRYNFIEEEPDPDTGIKENIITISLFIGIVVIYGIILIKMK